MAPDAIPFTFPKAQSDDQFYAKKNAELPQEWQNAGVQWKDLAKSTVLDLGGIEAAIKVHLQFAKYDQQPKVIRFPLSVWNTLNEVVGRYGKQNIRVTRCETEIQVTVSAN